MAVLIKSSAHLEKHMVSAHIAEYVKATEGAVENFVLHEMTHIG